MSTTHKDRTDGASGEQERSRTRGRDRGPDVESGGAPDLLGEEPLVDEHPLVRLQRQAGNRATQRLLGAGEGIHPKLRVGRANDRYEREADQVARAVLRGESARDGAATGDGTANTPAAPAIQRLCTRCRGRLEQGRPLDCPDCERTLQRSPSATGELPTVSDAVAGEIGRARGGGQPLPPGTRSFFESRFGHEFGDVRVHDGPRAAQLNRVLDARAFTLGRDVFFGASEYRPESERGRELLAHELTHVVQQGRSAATRPGVIRRQPVITSPGLSLMMAWEAWERSQQRHQQWVESHGQRHSAALAGRARTLSGVMERTRRGIASARMALFQAARSRSRPNLFDDPRASDVLAFLDPQAVSAESEDEVQPERVPSDLMERWLAADVMTDVVHGLLANRTLSRWTGFAPTPTLVPEPLPPERAAAEMDEATGTRDTSTEEVTEMDVPRGAFTRFYLSLLRLAETHESEQRRLEREFAVLRSGFEQVRSECQTGRCHLPTGPPQLSTYRAPPPRSPFVRSYLDHAVAATSTGEWLTVVSQFEAATEQMDAILREMAGVDSDEAQALDRAKDALDRQEALRQTQPEAVPVQAVFYPEDELIDAASEGGSTQRAAGGTEGESTQQVAKGIPWLFYVYHTGIDDGSSDPEWVIEDATAGKSFTARVPMWDGDVAMARQGAVLDPPRKLYKELNDDLLFPEGHLYWTTPTGETDGMETTEPWSLKDWAEAIGIGLGVLSLVLLTGGLGTAAVVAGVGAAVASTTATIADLSEKSEHGVLTDQDVDRAVLTIATDVASVATVGVGRVVAAAGRGARAAQAGSAAATTTRLSTLAGRAYVFAETTNATLELTTLVVTTDEILEQMRQIDAMSALSPAQKESAKARLVLTGIVTGTLTTVSVVGSVQSIRESSTPPPIRLEADAEGRVRIEEAGESGGSPAEPGRSAEPVDDESFLRSTRDREEIRASEAEREIELARHPSNRRRVTAEEQESGYVEAFEFNGHTWKRHRRGFWCRFSNGGECFVFPTGGSATSVDPGVSGPIRVDSGRYVVENADDVATLRQRSLDRPEGLSEEDARFWDRYVDYYSERLDRIAAELRHGAPQTPPPRTWESYLDVRRAMRQLERGTEFNEVVHRSMTDVGRIEIDFDNPERALGRVRNLRNRVPEEPPRLTEFERELWPQYVQHYRDRLALLEQQLTHGTPISSPPKTWEAFRFEHQFRTYSEVGVRPQSGEHAGELRRPDLLIHDLEAGTITTTSHKSRVFEIPEDDHSRSALEDVFRQVRADVEELVTKYSGNIEIRRPSHPSFDETVPVREVVLIYEQTGVPPDVARQIMDEARRTARQLDPSLDFQVTFQGR